MNADRFKRKMKKRQMKYEYYRIQKELDDAYMEYLPERKKRKVSNIMLAIVVIAIVGYTIANFWLQYQAGVEVSPTITTCWYAFWSTELIALTTIKHVKTKHEKN